jgi:hypothetical protein
MISSGCPRALPTRGPLVPALLVRALLVPALIGVLAGCGASEEPAAAPATPPPAAATDTAPPAPVFTGEQAEVEAVFRSYNQALVAQDYPAVCALNAPEANEAFLQAITEAGAPANTCEEGFALVFSDPQALGVARQIAETAQIQEITVEGERATIAWTAGQESVSSGLRRIDGEWRLLSPGA